MEMSGGKLARDDLLQLEGIVTHVQPAGHFIVKLESGQEIPTKLSGRMRKFNIRVILGDRVTVGVSPYDPTLGLIVHRQKLQSRKQQPGRS